VLAPHGDDETIGCGGWLIRNSSGSQRATVVFCAHRDAVRRREAAAALQGLAVDVVDLDLPELRPWARSLRRPAAARLIELIDEARPARIFVPNVEDPHPDHAGSHLLLLEALRDRDGTAPQVVLYEGLVPLGAADWWLDISDSMDEKLRRLGAYRSQVARYRLDEVVTHLNAYRGRTLLRQKITFAEAYRRMPLEEYRRCLENRSC
jgi:LmbE family N-acetylglucosaminyl deacetylase